LDDHLHENNSMPRMISIASEHMPQQGNAMKDTVCVAFLQWALPRMGLEWAGFRKVRKLVCKRIDRRYTSRRVGDMRGDSSFTR
jgi:hypothetical protein